MTWISANEQRSRWRRPLLLILIDEAAGRAEARRRRLRVTLGVLRAGAEQGVVNVPDLIARLKSTTFYLDETLVRSVFAPWLES